MNLYGFAGGDPINFSDPFGLCPNCGLLLAGAGGAAIADGPLPGPGDVIGAGLVVGAGITYVGYHVSNSDVWDATKRVVRGAVAGALLGLGLRSPETVKPLTHTQKAQVEAEQRKRKREEDQRQNEKGEKEGRLRWARRSARPAPHLGS